EAAISSMLCFALLGSEAWEWTTVTSLPPSTSLSHGTVSQSLVMSPGGVAGDGSVTLTLAEAQGMLEGLVEDGQAAGRAKPLEEGSRLRNQCFYCSQGSRAGLKVTQFCSAHRRTALFKGGQLAAHFGGLRIAAPHQLITGGEATALSDSSGERRILMLWAFVGDDSLIPPLNSWPPGAPCWGSRS
ncbi:hypothetical protein CRUP_011564, partial [Coryphaenoides rupestris]